LSAGRRSSWSRSSAAALLVAVGAGAALAGPGDVPGAVAPAGAPSLRWAETLGEALERARAEDRLCLLYLHRPPAT
jgi:hypothetical protein